MTPVALVTGGQQGIGLGIAMALADAGHRIAVVAEQAPDASTVVSGLRAIGDAARYYRHDLRDIDAAPGLVDRIEDEWGPVVTLVCNAGVPARGRGDLLDVGADSWDFVLGVNLRGGFFLAQAVARRMIAAPAGAYRSIVFVTSVSAAMVSVDRGEYCVSKAGAAMVAQLFAARLAPHGIGVFDIRPGIIETGMTEGVRDKYTARIEGGLVPAGRWGQPVDIASIVVPLARGDMAFATGTVIAADGGLSISRL